MIEQKTVDRQFLPKNPLFFDATSATSKKHTHLNPTQTTRNTSGWPKNSTYSPRSKPPHQLTTDAILVKINHTSWGIRGDKKRCFENQNVNRRFEMSEKPYFF